MWFVLSMCASMVVVSKGEEWGVDDYELVDCPVRKRR